MAKKNRTPLIIGAISAAALIIFIAERGRRHVVPGDFLDCKGLPRGMCNNNPGNIRFSHANNWQGKVPFSQNTDPGKSFEQFIEYRYGIRALIKLLYAYRAQGLDTLRKIMFTYAPPTENNTSGYIKFITDRTGIDEWSPLNWDKDELRELVQAIARVENGREAISDAQFNSGWALV